MTVRAVSAFEDLPIRFVAFTGAEPDFLFDGTSAEISGRRYEVRQNYREEDGEEIQTSTLVRIDAEVEHVVLSPRAQSELSVGALGGKLVVRCDSELHVIDSDAELVALDAWSRDGDPGAPLPGSLPVEYSFYAHPQHPLLVLSAISHRPVGDWLVVRRDGKHHLIGATELLNCGVIDGELVFHKPGVGMLTIEDLDELVARAGDAPVIEFPCDDLLDDFQRRLAAR